MPELPDIAAYCAALEGTVANHPIRRIILKSPFLVRTVEPDLFLAEGHRIRSIHRLGKRVVWELDDELFLIFHLMIAGRFHWRQVDARPRNKTDLAAFHFDSGTLMLTEASKQKRAALFVVQGRSSLAAYDPQGLEVFDCTASEFRERLVAENHTVKRALTDPKLFSGIGNAYSDEILHAAGLSPLKWTRRLTAEELNRLYLAADDILRRWTDKLVREARESFPERVTAFREEMAVHGRFGQPCRVCGARIQRVVYAENEMNYCPRCQTDGKLLADRSLSRLLKDDWPKKYEDLDPQ